MRSVAKRSGAERSRERQVDARGKRSCGRGVTRRDAVPLFRWERDSDEGEGENGEAIDFRIEPTGEPFLTTPGDTGVETRKHVNIRPEGTTERRTYSLLTVPVHLFPS